MSVSGLGVIANLKTHTHTHTAESTVFSKTIFN